MNDATSRSFDIDAFRRSVLADPLVQNVWENKYRWKDGPNGPEASIAESQRRVVEAVYANDPDKAARDAAMEMVREGYFLPAGRINAGAGTGRNVTLLNCFVDGIIQDSMPGIQLAIAKDSFTLQQGGGTGAYFGTLRPAGAIVRRTGSVSSGSIAFMDQRCAMSASVCSAGERRGAQMTTMPDDHPDLWNERQFETTTDYTGDKVLLYPSFISVKRQKGRLTQTNISVLVSDDFMHAVEDDLDWDLGFHVPRADGNHVDVYDKPFPYDVVEYDNDFTIVNDGRSPKKGDMLPWYVYTRVKARRIWDDIMRSTYVYAEPGVIFVDRVNARNNLYYCEAIACTNPCGEKPMPPDNVCDLGSLNLAFMVRKPFRPNADLDENLLRYAAFVGTRFLDNVLDVTNYPLREQREESMRKRRIGLGPTGLADALLQMGVRYGSQKAIDLTRRWTSIIQAASFEASADLARERGSFPAFDKDRFLKGYNANKLPTNVRNMIAQYGLRNGVLNTVAPNGTISIYSGNTGQGIEPVFSFDKVTRKVRQPDGSLAPYESVNYSYRLYEAMFGATPRDRLPDCFVGALDLSAEDHVKMQAACQEHIDDAISKTVNCPEGMTFDAFKDVYQLAYDSGCKGCTTYRPDPASGRGSVLSVEEAPGHTDLMISPDAATRDVILPRPRVLAGNTYKLKWPQTGDNWYVTINGGELGSPVEVFIAGSGEKYAECTEWVQAMGRLLTAVLRRGGDPRFLVGELTAIHAANGGAFIPEQKKFRASVVAAIGGVLEEDFRARGLFGVVDNAPTPIAEPKVVGVTVSRGSGPDACPDCGATPLVHEQGCVRCLSCDYTKCG